MPQEYFLADTEDLLDELDPRRDRMNTFYIYNEFSPKSRTRIGQRKKNTNSRSAENKNRLVRSCEKNTAYS